MRAFYAILPLALCFAIACNRDYTPKPYAYYAFDFPEKNYRSFDTSICPCTFDIPRYGFVEQEKKFFEEASPHPCWINIVFPNYNAKLYLSYSNISNRSDFERLLQDSYKLTFKHTQKADYIDEQLIDNPDHKVFGYIFDVGGNAASGIQFFVTDSTKHFIRGALYFNNTPNVDSLQPAIDFFKKDVVALINSTQWK